MATTITVDPSIPGPREAAKKLSTDPAVKIPKRATKTLKGELFGEEAAENSESDAAEVKRKVTRYPVNPRTVTNALKRIMRGKYGSKHEKLTKAAIEVLFARYYEEICLLAKRSARLAAHSKRKTIMLEDLDCASELFST